MYFHILKKYLAKYRPASPGGGGGGGILGSEKIHVKWGGWVGEGGVSHYNKGSVTIGQQNKHLACQINPQLHLGAGGWGGDLLGSKKKIMWGWGGGQYPVTTKGRLQQGNKTNVWHGKLTPGFMGGGGGGGGALLEN